MSKLKTENLDLNLNYTYSFYPRFTITIKYWSNENLIHDKVRTPSILQLTPLLEISTSRKKVQ